MGERYQIHFKLNFKKKRETGTESQYHSIHAQWMWGIHIIRNMNRLMTILKQSNLEYQYNYPEETGQYLKAILTLNRSLDGEYYPYRVHLEKPYLTTQGDSNHGWCVVLVNVDKEGKVTSLKSRFYNVEGNPVSNKQLLKDCEDEAENMSNDERVMLFSLLDEKLFNNTKLNLQKTFNEEVAKLPKSEESE